MRILHVRRVTQAFFLALALLLAFVATPGEGPLQMRGWPVSWFLELDPLVAFATVLATGALFAGLIWALVTIALTLVFGRVFCGWVCPFGTLHQFIGWLGRRGRSVAEQRAVNRPRRGHAIKYYLLVWLLVAAAGDLLLHWMRLSSHRPPFVALVAAVGALGLAWLVVRGVVRGWVRGVAVLGGLLALWVGLGFLSGPASHRVAALQIGLVDPLSFFFRSVDLTVVPLVDGATGFPWGGLRAFAGVWLVGGLFLAALLVNLWQPRFYCRYLCPLGALLGLVGRNAIWRIGRLPGACTACNLCDRDCEGACEPTGTIRQQECVVCLNCREPCRDGAIVYGTSRSPAGEDLSTGVTRRGLLTAAAAGAVTTPLLRLRPASTSRSAGLVRPPGALPEPSFLSRCIKCGQCMRVCPTGVLQPAGLDAGAEPLWTPRLDNRAGVSGCQPACVACSTVCPTAAIRPITIDEKMGKGAFAERGPIRLGTSFFDRGRCLPWAMDRPCVVCEENCPVSPKAIYLRPIWNTVRFGERRVVSVEGGLVRVDGRPLVPGDHGNGDFALRGPDGVRRPVVGNDEAHLVLPEGAAPLAAGDAVALQIHLQRPYVDPDRCTGCGICEHVCPLTGRAAIRITPENESRNPRSRMIAGGTTTRAPAGTGDGGGR